MFMIKSKSLVKENLVKYSAGTEKEHHYERHKIKSICLDRDVENLVVFVINFSNLNGIELEESPAQAPQSNGAAERLILDHWTRT